jgi:hypothetical protein
MHPGAEADTLQYADDSFSALFHAESAIPQGHIDIVVECQIRDQIKALEDETNLFIPDPTSIAVTECGHIPAIERVRTRRHTLQKTSNVEQCGLARARGTGDSEELPFAYVKVNLPQGMRSHLFDLKDLAQSLHSQHLPPRALGRRLSGALRSIQNDRIA